MSICALALVLLLDASGSVHNADWQLQVDGHAAAFRDHEIVSAIRRTGPTAVAVIGFSSSPHILINWNILENESDVEAFADMVAGVSRPWATGTETGRALREGLRLLDEVPCVAEREVVDVVTDGPGTDAVALDEQRELADSRGTTINVLTVGGGDDSVLEWARRRLASVGGFVLGVSEWSEFGRVIRRKILLELG